MQDETDPTRSGGFLSWAFTTDHRRIGVMYLVSILMAAVLGGFLAMLMRAELAHPGEQFLGQSAYNQMFTLHGMMMLFLVALPGVPATLGNFALPLMLGAKNVAFPRLNWLGYMLWLVGAFLFLAVMSTGGLDTGWTFSAPYSMTTESRVLTAGCGLIALSLSSLLIGLNFIYTLHTLRPDGMTLLKMPLFLWALYVTSLVQVLVTPVLIVAVFLLAGERMAGLGMFDPALGGDPGWFQHLFWIFAHPAHYLALLPALGILSELIPVFSRRPIFGRRFVLGSIGAVALLGLLAWGQHLNTSGQPTLAGMIFSAAAFAICIPLGLLALHWAMTMHKGSIELATPMCYALAFFVLFGMGELSGLFLRSMSTGTYLQGTAFEVAHLHYAVTGAAFAFLAGLHYWWPIFTGRMYNEAMGRIGCGILFVGYHLTFFPLFVAGSRGMIRRVVDYRIEFAGLQMISSAGSLLLAIGFFWLLGYLLHSLRNGRPASENPWDATTLEWQSESPPFENTGKRAT